MMSLRLHGVQEGMATNVMDSLNSCIMSFQSWGRTHGSNLKQKIAQEKGQIDRNRGSVGATNVQDLKQLCLQ